MIEPSPQRLLTTNLGALPPYRTHKIPLEQNLNLFEVIQLSRSVTTSEFPENLLIENSSSISGNSCGLT